MRNRFSPQSILIVKLSALGDVIMALPTLRALKARYPEAAIDWLVEAPTAAILQDDPDLRQVIISPRHKLRHFIKRGCFFKAFGLFRSFRGQLRITDYDVVLDLQGLLKSGINLWLSRGRRKVGFDGGREKSHWFLNEKMPPYDPDRHAALRYLDAAIHLGAHQAETPPHEPYYTPTAAGIMEAERLLASVNGPFVVFNPGTRRAAKCWPLPYWEELTRRLLSQTDLTVVVTGGADDVSSGEALTKINPRVLNLCRRSTLPGLAAILAKTRLMITGDTGPMHLAAAVGSGGLAFFGPTQARRTGPFGGHFKILTPSRPCVGCLKRQCPENCLAELSVDTVWEQLKLLLDI